MKKKITSFFTFVVMTTMMLSLTACGEEVNIDPNPNSGGNTEFFTESKKVIGDDGTRTSTDEDRYFYWTVGDKIWVEQSTDNWIQSLSNTITAVQPSAKFYFNEPLPEETYNIRYTGFGNTSAKSVTIQPTQTQSAWKNGDHIATSGDCGIATATHQGDRKYKFSLAHKAAYVILYPYMVSSIPTHYTLDRTYTLMKVEVTSSDNAEIAGTFNFGSTGITGAATSNASNMITLNCSTSGFALENNSNPSKNYLVVVMRPVELNRLTFTYYVKDNTDGTVFTYPVSPGIRTYSPNGFTILTHTIPDMVLNPTYYKWGATSPYSVNGTWNSTTVAPTQLTTGVWQYAPNVNEMIWYVEKGGAISDYQTRWRRVGEGDVRTYGFWFKKKEIIASENSKTVAALAAAAPDGKDYRSVAVRSTISGSTIIQRENIPIGSPTSGAMQNRTYFYLPCFGYMGQNGNSSVYYWTKSPDIYTTQAWRLGGSGQVLNIQSQTTRDIGEVVGQGWFQ